MEGRYSNTAANLVRELVTGYDFKIVLITRHGANESALLRERLALAGIANEWLHPDPDAIPETQEYKGDAIMAWFKRNPEIREEDTVALEDQIIQLKGYPEDRVVAINPRYGFTRQNFNTVLERFGIMPITLIAKATLHPIERGQQVP